MSDADLIDGFLHRFSPEVEASLRDSREQLRARFLRGYELVFDNDNALVFGFSPTESCARWGSRLTDPSIMGSAPVQALIDQAVRTRPVAGAAPR